MVSLDTIAVKCGQAGPTYDSQQSFTQVHRNKANRARDIKKCSNLKVTRFSNSQKNWKKFALPSGKNVVTLNLTFFQFCSDKSMQILQTFVNSLSSSSNCFKYEEIHYLDQNNILEKISTSLRDYFFLFGFFFVSLPFSIEVILSLSLFCNCFCFRSLLLPTVGLLSIGIALNKRRN